MEILQVKPQKYKRLKEIYEQSYAKKLYNLSELDELLETHK